MTEPTASGVSATARRWPTWSEVLPALAAIGAILIAVWTITGPRASAAANAARLNGIEIRLEGIGERLDRMEARSKARFEELRTDIAEVRRLLEGAGAVGGSPD